MNRNLTILFSSVFAATLANAEPEVSGKITYESASFTKAGHSLPTSAAPQATGANYTHAKDEAFKQELTARIYVDGNLNDDLGTYHLELLGHKNPEAVSGLDGGQAYTQRDPLREAYVDTSYNDWAIRAGKQQVVWGTADGMKLLDIVNPTDYTEMAQNQMEDSRITTWMINGEKFLEDGGSVQVVASQPRENIFAGLDREITPGIRANSGYAANGTGFADLTSGSHHNTSPFVLKGVDTITGKKNGFLNIVPDLGGIAGKFAWGFGKQGSLYDPRMAGFTVGLFEGFSMGGSGATSMPAAMAAYNMICHTDDAGDADQATAYGTCPSSVTNADFDDDSSSSTFSYKDLPDNFQSAVVAVAATLSPSYSYNSTTGMVSTSSADVGISGSTALNNDTTFTALANAVTGAQMLAYGFQPNYNTNLADTDSVDDTAFDYMGSARFNTFDTYVGATSEYVYDMPSDADVDLSMRYRNTTESGVNYSLVGSYNYDKNPVIKLSWHDQSGNALTQSTDAYGGIILYDKGTTAKIGNSSTTTMYGGSATVAAGSERYAKLRFTQTLERATNIGGSFDMAIENEQLGPIVIRGEALYQKDVYSPIIDKSKLVVGDILGALKMEKGDKFKYVLGADITALTNMMVSFQFIQERDLDFVDGNQSSGRYTAAFPTMHLTNGLKKGLKNKEFYTVFLSKPFGASDQHRWNNIYMIEEGGGRWNRLDAEYTIDDNTVATAEFNKYWGDENTQFGQLEKSSNIQLGLKYSF